LRLSHLGRNARVTAPIKCPVTYLMECDDGPAGKSHAAAESKEFLGRCNKPQAWVVSRLLTASIRFREIS
jgi:hypothetical protein